MDRFSRVRNLSNRVDSLSVLSSAGRGLQPAAPAAARPLPALSQRMKLPAQNMAAGGIGGGFGGGGFGPAGRGGVALGKSIERLSREDGARSYAAQVLVADSEGLNKAAQQAQQAVEAQRAAKTDDPAAQRQALLRAYFLDLAAANAGQTDGSNAAQALEALEELHQKQTQKWIAEMPQLGKRLDLVLRDKSIQEALDAVGQAAGVKIALLPGSVEDVTALLQEEPRVTYLDLRRATVAQALDWILQPARMSWQPADGGITAGTDRRRAGTSAWIYDVADMALPLSEDLQKLGDYQKAVAETKKAADEFLAAVRQELKADDKSVVWYAPGEVLVFGDQPTHAKIAGMFASWRGPGAKRQGSLADTVFQRVTARKEQLAKARQARELLAAAAVHDHFGWQLLAAAAGGRVDDEALTELAIAWRNPATAELLKGEGAGLALRSLWIVREASRSLPNEPELAALAETALKQSHDARQQALKTLETNQADESARLGALYAALAQPEDAGYRAKALGLLSASKEPADALPLRARMLLGEPAPADRASLVKLLTQSPESIAGPDSVTLAALACRRAGGEAWDTFRAQSPSVLGNQQLPGEIVVLVNELSTPQLLLARQP
jgi:hypothetical protein